MEMKLALVYMKEFFVTCSVSDSFMVPLFLDSVSKKLTCDLSKKRDVTSK